MYLELPCTTREFTRTRFGLALKTIRSALKALTKKMRMKAEIRFGAKTIVTSLSCDILCDRQKCVSYMHMYQSMCSVNLCVTLALQ